MPYVPDNLEDLNAAKQSDTNYNTQPIPRHYQKVIKNYSYGYKISILMYIEECIRILLIC